MRRLLFTMVIAGVLVVPASVSAEVPGEMLFQQGCEAFDLVEDLGGSFTPIGAKGRWLVRSLKDGRELLYVYEGIDLVNPPSEDPSKISGTTLVAWEFEGTGVQGSNRSDYTLTIVDQDLNSTAFFQGKTFRGTRYKSGGISGTATGNLATGEFVYDAVRIVLCKAGFGGK